MRLEELSIPEWEDALPDDGYEVFHSPELLRVVDDYCSSKLQLFGGFKGRESVGLMPVFVREMTVGRLVTSPPPGLGIGRLGPVLMPTSPKQRKRESENREFARKVIEATSATGPFTLFRMPCGIQYEDPRPFQWMGLSVEPGFTYRLDLASATDEQILNSFSRDLRKDIRNGNEAGVTIQTRGIEGAKRVYRSMQERFREQGTSHPMSWEFVRDVLDALEDNARVYVAESDEGDFLSGMIVLYSNGTAYNWKGGSKPSIRNTSISPNNLLHWRIIEDVLTDPKLDPIERYDLYTANDERLARYKSSFGGTLTPYYIVESAGLPMEAAKRAYQVGKRQKRLLDR